MNIDHLRARIDCLNIASNVLAVNSVAYGEPASRRPSVEEVIAAADKLWAFAYQPQASDE